MSAFISSSSAPSYPFVFSVTLYASTLFISKSLKELQNVIYLPVQKSAYVELADRTFVHLHRLSLQWHIEKKMGSVVRSITRGIQSAQTMMQYGVLLAFPTIFETMAVSLIFLFHFENPRLSVLIILMLIAYAFATVKITVWRKQFMEKTTQKDNKLHENLQDSLLNFESIKYYCTEEFERRRFRNTVTEFQQYSVASQGSLALLNISQQSVINMSVALGLLLYVLEREDTIDVGSFIAVNSYIFSFFAPLSGLGFLYNQIVTSLVDMQTFARLMNQKCDIVDPPQTVHGARTESPKSSALVPALELRDVSFKYIQQPIERSLRNVSFSVYGGTTTAIVGETGAGKTTLSRLLVRFYDPTEGSILLNGVDIRKIRLSSLRMKIGCVPQDVVLFNETIAFNLRYGKLDASDDELVKAARSARLLDFIQSQPLGFNTLVGERGLKLSGGEKQRLAIGRCILKDPAIALLDEATSALDSTTERQIQEAIAALSKKRTTVVIAHRLGTVKSADEIIVLENGRIAEKGSHAELLENATGIYTRLWKAQDLNNADKGGNITV